MSKELVISSSRHETRVALLEEDQLVEIYHQRENEYSLAGSIHKGRVTRVLPGMQSAFVDIGLERDAFLYVSDFFEDNEEYDKIVTSVEEKVLKLDKPLPAAAQAEPAVCAEEPSTTENEAAAALVAQAAAPSAALAGAGLREDRDGRDRDRRGRRGRRRRGSMRGGSRLPESKFYSPEREAAPQAPAAEAPSAPVADDFFVLPGETLAKYRRPEEEFDEAAEAENGLETTPGTELPAEAAAEPSDAATAEAAAAAAAPEHEEVSGETTPADVAAEPGPAAEPAPEPAAVSEPVVQSAPEPAAEPHIEAAAAAAEAEAEPSGEAESFVEPAPEAEAAQEAEPEAGVDAEFEAGAETEGESEALPEGGEGAPAEVEGVPDSEAVSAAEDESPEPARIPTSLTATLREQGPRYLHRVSRRMRRKDRRGQADAQPRPAVVEAARQEQRTAVRPAEKPGQPSIADLLKEGQEIIVQIAKEPLGQKGARITSHIALPGRFLVYMPTVDHVGVSRKIPSEDERTRLKRILQSNRAGIPGGFIVRTAGDGHSEEELRADMHFLYNLWLDMRQKAERRPAPALIHHDLNVVERVLRDQLTSSFKNIWVDNEELYEAVLSFVQRFQPSLVSRVKLYTRSTPIFDEFGITAELEKALRPKVWLKSGGYIVINQTEALVAVDINTGKYVGKSNRLEDTIVKTNTDAIREIVRQIRLRDLGGIIVVDFIDMDERKNRQKVMQALEEAMKADRAPYKILQFNDFGLVAITRKRVKQSLERTLCSPCPYCEGAGYVKSPQTVVGEILQEAHRVARAVDGKDVLLRVNPEVGKVLKSNQNTYLQELEEILGRTVIVKSDAQLHQEKFDLA